MTHNIGTWLVLAGIIQCVIADRFFQGPEYGSMSFVERLWSIRRRFSLAGQSLFIGGLVFGSIGLLSLIIDQ